MGARKSLATATIAVSMIASSMGGATGKERASLGAIPEANPKRNADGNYNIIFLITDQEHYFQEHPHGTEWEARDLLAQLGTTFEKHYACTAMSTSSRSVIYTGTHIPHTRMIDNTDFDWQGPLSEDLATVGDMMRTAGFYTAYKGKWHMGDASILDNSGGGLNNLEPYGFSDWEVEGDYIGTMWEGWEKDPEISGDAVKWLQGTGASKNSEGTSFFLAVNLINPHDVMYYNTDKTFRGMVEVGGAPDDGLYGKTYDEDIPLSWNQDLSDGSLPPAIAAYKERWERQTGSVNSADGWKDFRNYYFNCIQDSDNSLMNVLQALIRLDMLDNSIIVFTSDHGEMAGTHSLKGKGGVIYEENIHVPLVICHPEHRGRRSVRAVTSHVDLAPTFVRMAGISEERKKAIIETLPGRNLMDLLDGTSESVRQGALFCFEMISMTMAQAARDETGNLTYTFDKNVRGFVRSAITERYKFARYFSAEFNTPRTLEEILEKNDIELYDLENDPGETHNLAADFQTNSALILELNRLLNELIAREIGKDDGSEVAEELAPYLPDPEEGACNAGIPSMEGIFLLIPLLALIPAMRSRK